MIHLERRIAGGRTAPDMAVAISCDRCGGRPAAGGWCDPDDLDAAALTAEWVRVRAGWKRSGRMILCPDCKRPGPAITEEAPRCGS